MKSLHKALLGAAILTGFSAAQADTLGTINLVQINLQVKTKPATPTEFVSPSATGAITDTLKSYTDRLTSRSVIEALAADDTSGFPAGATLTGWNVVEAFQADDGTSLGFFAYKPGFTPIALTDSFFSTVIPDFADSFETFSSFTSQTGGVSVLTKDVHYYTADITGSVLVSGTDHADATFTDSVATFGGSVTTTTNLHNLGPKTAPTTTYISVIRKGIISGNSADYSISGSFTSIGRSGPVNVQDFVDASVSSLKAAK